MYCEGEALWVFCACATLTLDLFLVYSPGVQKINAWHTSVVYGVYRFHTQYGLLSGILH